MTGHGATLARVDELEARHFDLERRRADAEARFGTRPGDALAALAVAVDERRPGVGLPWLVKVDRLVELLPALKARTVRHWIAQARPRVVQEGGRSRTLPGNGLERAIVRPGRTILVDVDRFVEWLYGGHAK